MEEAQAVPMVVAMDLEVEVVDMVAEGFKTEMATVLSRRESRSCQGSYRLL